MNGFKEGWSAGGIIILIIRRHSWWAADADPDCLSPADTRYAIIIIRRDNNTFYPDLKNKNIVKKDQKIYFTARSN